MSQASDFLMAQYQLRKNKNPRYSQGAFARLLEINSGRLTQYFSGKRLITKAAAKRLAEKLELDQEQQEYFLHLCDTDKINRKSPNPKLIEDDQLALLVEWHHLAVLYLTHTKDFKLDHAWMSKRLGIPVELVTSSLDRLERVGLIKIIDGKIKQTDGPFTTSSGIPNQYLLMSHKDMLRYMTSTLTNVPVEKRDLSSITLAVDDSKINEARELIRKFRRRLANLMSDGKRNQVYAINIQLYPLSTDS